MLRVFKGILDMEQLESGSLDLTKMNIEKVKELFPSIVTEGTIDFEMLKILLGGGRC